LRENGFISASLPVSDKADGKKLYLQHDVDADIESARRLAEIEVDVGFTSTFFFLVGSDFYNIFSKEAQGLFSYLVGWGYGIGLHYDASLGIPAKTQSLILEVASCTDIGLATVHQGRWARDYTEEFVKAAVIDARVEPTEHSVYRADSYGEWRHGHPLDLQVLAKSDINLCINCHPLWWNEEYESRIFLLHEFVDRKKKQVAESLAENIAALF